MMTSERPHSKLGSNVKRIRFEHIMVGMTLLHNHEIIGTVVAVEDDAIELDNGKRLTRRGWQSKSLWRKIENV